MKTSRANATNILQSRNHNGSNFARKISMLAAAVFALLMMSTIASAQLSGPKSIPGDYATVAAAVTDLNTQGVGAGGVTFNVAAGYTETAPAGGFSITATGTAGNTIVFQKSGAGTNPTFTAPTPQTSGNLNDAIFKIIGGDFITIDGFTMLENPANTTTAAATNNMTEWGVALLYATTTNGSQNDTIQNCTIDLDRTYQNTFGIYSNSTHSATAVTTSATATTAAGGNDNLKIYGNTITDVNMGIVHIGPTAAADQNPTADIGGVALATGNTITNWGTTQTFSGYANVSGTVNGILVRNTKNFNISFNTVTSSNGGVTAAATINGIQIPASSNTPTGTLTQTINNNIISVRGGNIANILNGINMPSGSVNATTTVNMNNNDFNTFGHTVAGGTGAITFMSHGGNPLTQTFNTNTFTNMSVNTTGTITFFSFAPSLISGAALSLSGNNVVTGFTRTGIGTTIVWSSNASSVAGSTHAISNNNFSNITLTGASAFTGISDTDGGAPVKTINGNTFNNIVTGAGTVVPMSVNFSGAGTVVNNNTISNITTTNSITCLSLGSSNAATITAQGNVIDPITSGGASVIGISVAGIGAVVSKNKIYDISGTAAGSVVAGIANVGSTSGSTITIVNNLIGNLTAPAATSSNGVIGINITGSALTSTFNVFYNTVYVNNTTSGAGFGSSGISTLASATSTTSTLNLRNNIIVNTSVQNGAGVTVAYRRSLGTAGALANYAGTSNNNDFYAGAPSATNLIYSDGTSSAQTISAYRSGVFTAGSIAPRDSASVSENPPFLSTTGSSANFLHINPGTPTQLESGGAPVAGIADDFDAQARNVSTPDIGADEFAGILLDLVPPTISYTPLGNASVSTTRSFTNVVITDPSGVNTAPGTRPRVYYKKSTDTNDLAATGWKFVEASGGGGSPFSFTIDYSLLNAGSVTTGDTIQYFVVAQDLAATPNVGINSGTFNSQPSSVALTASAFPIGPVINSYNIATAISGSKTVCSSGCDYTSLTNASGVFDSINTGVVTGNLTINIAGDLVAESGSFALNQLSEEGVGGYTVTIQPSGAPRSVTSTAAAVTLIKLNGASRITINGSIGGAGSDRSLTMENIGTVTPQVIWIGSVGTTAVSNDTVKNCIVRNGANTSSAIVISDAGTAGNPGVFSNITVQNNSIQKAFIGVFATGGTSPQGGSNLVYTGNNLDTAGANAIRLAGLYMQGVNGATVSQNTIGNFNATNDENDIGIWLASGTINATVSGNTISALNYTGTAAFSPIGINVTPVVASSNDVVSQNTISNMTSGGSSSGSLVMGISVSGASDGVTIQKNIVQNINNSNPATWPAIGINLNGGNNHIVRNNFVSRIFNDQTAGTGAFSPTFGVSGIRLNTGSGHQIYNNSVHLYGAMVGTVSTDLLSALAVAATTVTNCDIRNNILSNEMTGGNTTGGSTRFVAINLPSGGTAAMNLTLNNNAYFEGTDPNDRMAVVGVTSGTGDFSAANFNPGAVTPATNFRSYSSTLSAAGTNDNASFASTAAPPFVSASDLHITPAAGAILGGGAVIASVTTDIDADPRPASNPDIGADELVQAVGGVIPAGTFYNASAAPGDQIAGDVTITNSLYLNGTLLVPGGKTLTIGCDASLIGASATNYIVGNLLKNFCATGAFNFAVGTIGGNPGYSPVNATVTALGTNPSSLLVLAQGVPQPNVNPATSIKRYWTLTEGGNLTADLVFNYLDPQDIMGNEANYKLIRVTGGVPVSFPGSVNTVANTASLAGVSNFSDWTVGENAAPTAAPATISGRVTTTSGGPLAGVTMRLSGAHSGMTITDADGNYRFVNIDTNNFYTVTPAMVNYHFSPGSRSFSLLANVTDAVFSADRDAVSGGNVIDTPEYFVRQHYLDFLGREPDNAGLNFWSNQMRGCGNDFNCLERRTINVSAAYFLSIEFQKTGGLIDSLYRASYGRAPLFAEFMPDRARVARDVIVNEPDWERQLATNTQEFLDAWVERAAFHAAYDNLTNDGYVDALIANTGVTFTDAERATLVAGLNGGTLTRAQALQRVAENQTFVRAKFNEAFVRMQYFGYLRRDPDDSGFHYWLNKLNEFEGNFERAEMVKAFIVSSEYRDRFRQQ